MPPSRASSGRTRRRCSGTGLTSNGDRRAAGVDRARRRRPWSKRNAGIAERLVAEGRMHPAGVAEIERAKADGRWDAAYAGPAAIEVPPELAAALAADPKAQAMFERLNSQNRYAILYRITTAKRHETRARRIEEYVAMLARGETIYPLKRLEE